MDSIIFDVDGTLWDATEAVSISWTQAVKKYASREFIIRTADLKRVFGRVMTEIADTLFSPLPKEERLPLLLHCYDEQEIYLRSHHWPLYEGASETIRKLAEKYPLYIVSNCQLGYIETLLETTGVEPYFQDHLCFGETNAPKSETLARLIQKNNLKSPVYIGDTQGDADACFEAGVPFIFAEYGFGDVPDAKVRINKINDLEKILL